MFTPQRGPLLVTSLAVCLARRAFPELEFVTDRRGADLAERLGWRFDSVNLALENYPAAGLEHVWALGKLVALLLADVPVIQFDGDVCLLKPLPERMHKARLCAQSPDIARFYLGDDMERGMQRLGLPRAAAQPFNAGLIGGRDLPLLHDYAAESLALAQQFRGFDLNGTTASMLCEQYALGIFAKRRRARVECLLPEMPTRRQVARAGYVHLVGSHKRSPHYVAKAEARLARDFPDAYARFLEGWQKIGGAGSPLGETVWASAL